MELKDYESFLTRDKGISIFRANFAIMQFEQRALPKHLLDVGCGGGELLRAAKERGVTKLTGVDGVQDALEQCKDIQGKIYEIDLNTQNLPFADQSFDGVTCLEVLEHLYAPQKTLAEIYRVLEDEKWAIISIPNPFTYSMRLKILFGENISDPATVGGHIKFFRRQDLKKYAWKRASNTLKS